MVRFWRRRLGTTTVAATLTTTTIRAACFFEPTSTSASRKSLHRSNLLPNVVSQQQQHQVVRSMVNLHGNRQPVVSGRRKSTTQSPLQLGRPPDPRTLLDDYELEIAIEQLGDWFDKKRSVLCITGAGLSTESGIPDYRGYAGSYHTGHKPMVHDQFMNSSYQRKRYWGRGMVGWRYFDQRKPNAGHYALVELERYGHLGVVLEEDSYRFYDPMDDDQMMEYYSGSGLKKLTIITQNVDSLHSRAGSEHVVPLHGETHVLKCMSCGAKQDRRSFHLELEALNKKWLDDEIDRQKWQQQKQKKNTETERMRPDGDASVITENYDDIKLPGCKSCGTGFLKPDVVFFGDSVPKHRVELCKAAVEACDGILVVGSSLAVHSVYRHVRAATTQYNTPVALLNVGTTRAEAEGLPNLTKIEAPAGKTLTGAAAVLRRSQTQTVISS